MRWATGWAVLAALAVAPGCGGATKAPGSERNESARDGWQRISRDGISLAYRDGDAAGAPGLLDLLVQGRAQVESFFGAEFPAAIAVYVYPDRDSLTAHWREAWRMPALETECWMVASGEADELTLLSPRVWASEACEHDAGDRVRTAALITHELVHVFHGQHLTGRSFDGMDGVGWFVEGLATHASGQLELGYLASAAEAIAAGKDPIHLRQAWSGTYRYGVCGSIVSWIDSRLGRAGLRALLPRRTEAELLAAIGLTEAALLADWKQAIVEGASTVSITPPWSITYHDGSGNGYRLWQDDAVAHFEYTPVTPAMSSSGTYSGGAPARGDLTAAQVRELWTTIDALARETALHTNSRDKGTGAFTTTTPTASNTFLIRWSDQLRELDTALARIRLP